MNAADIPSFLKEKVGPFQDLSDERLAQLVAGGRVVSVEASEAVAHCGDDPRFLGIVLEGELVASAPGEGGRAEELLRFKAGDTFNELALMTGDAVLADFIAESRCEVLLIPVSLFQSVIVAEPGAVQQISRTIAERMKAVLADPAKAAAALRQSDDPYGLKLKGERPPGKVLVINCGSSSLKYSFYDTTDEASHARGLVERIGIDGTRHVHRGPKGEVKRELPKGGFAEAFKAMAGGAHGRRRRRDRRRRRGERGRASRGPRRREDSRKARSSPTRCWRRSRRSIRSRRCTIR